jgi:prolyl oligopeptidase
VAIEDPFRWLEDESDPRVQQFVAEEDQRARAYLQALPGRAALAERLRELFYVDAISAPRRYGSRYFYSRTHADKEKAVLYVREGRDGIERVLLDPNQLSADGSLSIGYWQPSPDGRVVAYAERCNNSDEATLRLLDVEDRGSGLIAVPRPHEVIVGAKYAYPSFTPDGSAFYYTYLPTHAPSASASLGPGDADAGQPLGAAERPGFAEVRLHRLGESADRDLLVYPATGSPSTFLQCELSRDGRYLVLYLQYGWSACDVYYCDLQRVAAPPWGGPPAALRAAFVPLRVGVAARYQVLAWQDRFYLFTNEGAPRGRVLWADATAAPPLAFQELVPEDHSDGDQGAVITDVSVVGGALGVHALRRAHSELWIYPLPTGEPLVTGAPLAPPRQVELPGLGQSYGFIGNPEDDEFYYHYTSFVQPPQIFRSSVAAGGAALWAEVKLPLSSGADSPFLVEQVRYPSRDGTLVSMFLVGRRDRRRDGNTPFLLIGYGGFNVSLLPEFSAGLLTFLEHGGAFAVANLRGGGEYGEAWHSAGMLAHKQNVFDDFLSAAEYLIAEGHTRADRLAIRGGSNGGLLVGAALTQRPELFAAAICAVPLLDMLRYHRFGSGQTWIPEYGNPDEEADFRVLAAYSPYHHVGARPYPAVLMLSADHDDRVDPMHARKMTALLKARTTGRRPILLRVEHGAGHGGADLVRKTIEQAADTYAFLLSELGMGAQRR